jgi:hypothetical protein
MELTKNAVGFQTPGTNLILNGVTNDTDKLNMLQRNVLEICKLQRMIERLELTIKENEIKQKNNIERIDNLSSKMDNFKKEIKNLNFSVNETFRINNEKIKKHFENFVKKDDLIKSTVKNDKEKSPVKFGQPEDKLEKKEYKIKRVFKQEGNDAVIEYSFNSIENDTDNDINRDKKRDDDVQRQKLADSCIDEKNKHPIKQNTKEITVDESEKCQDMIKDYNKCHARNDICRNDNICDHGQCFEKPCLAVATACVPHNPCHNNPCYNVVSCCNRVIQQPVCTANNIKEIKNRDLFNDRKITLGFGNNDTLHLKKNDSSTFKFGGGFTASNVTSFFNNL